jgi:UDP-N-acetylmuramate--alanine ligase
MTHSPRHYHLMGIGGIGVSALARILKHDGHIVSGCDQKLTDLTETLQTEGIPVSLGHDPHHLEGVDVLVASTAIPQTEPELVNANFLGIPVRRRIQVVGDILARGYSLGVTGSHGKTSTTSMLACIFLVAQSDPTLLLGANLPQIGGNSRLGGGPRVAEIDESDPLFQFLELDVAVITNLEADHISPDGKARPNYHASQTALQEAVAAFAQRAKVVVYNLEPRWGLEALTAGAASRVSFGGGDCFATEVQLKAFGSQFELVWKGQNLGTVVLEVPGEHNVSNAVAAAAAALVSGVPFSHIQAGLGQYSGASRRFEKLGELNGALVVDDYAHNATKLLALLKAAKNTGLRVRAVFQPHRYGRSEQEWAQYAEALEYTDETWILDVYAAGEEPVKLSSAQIGRNIVDYLHQLGKPAQHQSWDNTLKQLRATAGAGDLILTIGAGNVNQLGHALVGSP